MRKLVVLVLIALGVLLVTPAVASASTPTLKSLAKAVKALQKTEKSQAAAITSLKGTVTSQAGTISSLQIVVGADVSHGLRKSVATIAANPALTLSWLPSYLSLDKNAINGVKGPNLVFKGCNLQIKSSTSESDTTGTGNLIVGWDDAPPNPVSGYRAGSNNLVCGDQDSFLSYAGFLGGCQNSTAGAYETAGGGAGNSVSDYYSSICGGTDSTASGSGASVCGGYDNFATGPNATIVGGQMNTANANCASIGGGVDLGDRTMGHSQRRRLGHRSYRRRLVCRR